MLKNIAGELKNIFAISQTNQSDIPDTCQGLEGKLDKLASCTSALRDALTKCVRYVEKNSQTATFKVLNKA